MREFQFFDPGQVYSVVTRKLPHWSQPGTLVFITWRSADSLPRVLQDRLTRERELLLRQMGLDPRSDWRAALERLPAVERGRAKWRLFQLWDELLDGGAGACVLARPELSAIVEDSLLHFDADRYELTDSVVMPNHVHLLVAFPDESSLSTQCESWKRFTGREINRSLHRTGEFWQVEHFDHLVRSEDQFWHYRRYIAENGQKAGLAKGEYRWFSKNLI
jgi:type I restriction enzyme R subunit